MTRSMLDALFNTAPPKDGLPADTPRGKEAVNALATELLYEMRVHSRTLTEVAAQLQGMIVNSVIQTRTIVFDASGVVALQWKVAAGSIYVDNLSAAGIVTVSAAGATTDNAAPAQGNGVYKIKGGQARTVPLASRQVTLYGTNGDTVCIVAYAAGPQPKSGS